MTARIAVRALPGIEVQTESGRIVSKTLLQRFPYAIYFELLEDQCVIWAVAHGRRCPHYWRERL